MDFFILEMKEYWFTPILLGRPFLATAKVIVDVNKKELAIRSGKEYENLRFPSMSRGKMKENEYDDFEEEEEIKELEGQGHPSTS